MIADQKKIILTQLKKIYNPKGDIFHALKKSEDQYTSFGEAYFTSIHKGEIKGWKKHKKMTLNLIVPSGHVRFYIHYEEEKKSIHIDLGVTNYLRLTIKPGLWVAFEGIGDGLNLILNIADIEHNPTESVNKDINDFPLK